MKHSDLTSIIKDIEERKKRALIQVSRESKSISSEVKEEKDILHSQSTFCVEDFMAKHTEATYKSLTNFNEDEIDELTHIIESTIGEKSRGKRPKISVKGSIFITLFYYSTYSPITVLSSVLTVKIPTIERIIKRVTNSYFPVFASKFIPKTLIHCKRQFINFPSAIGAVDSSTIEFYRPKSREKQKESWDAKNRINGIKLQALVNPAGKAIHVCVDYMGSVHDKKLFDISGLTDFVTVKRGVETVILPILADRGYIGIEKFHTSAIVQQKGNDPEIQKRNNFIAQDRQIVERFFGRFKSSWGAMSDGYRGDRDGIKPVILGLVALTNYNIDQHPLNACDDPFNENFDDGTEKVQEFSIIVSRKTEHRYDLPVCNISIGLQNQGSTCHLNAVIQVLIRIPLFVQVVEQVASFSPAKELHEIFDKMLQASRSGFQADKVISTVKLTSALKNSQWTAMQDCTDTYEMLIKMIDHLIKSNDETSDIMNLFTIKMSEGNWLTFNTYAEYSSVDEAIHAQVNQMSVFIPPPLLVVNIGRKMDKEGQRPYQKIYKFPFELELQSSNGEKKHYTLISIIAYASLHFITFNKTESEWRVFDDENVYCCNEELLQGLFGSSNEEDAANNPLWKHTVPYKWTARLLLYKDNELSF